MGRRRIAVDRRSALLALAAYPVVRVASGFAGHSAVPQASAFATVAELVSSPTEPRAPGTTYVAGGHPFIETGPHEPFDVVTGGGAFLRLAVAAASYPLEAFGGVAGADSGHDNSEALRAALKRAAGQGGGAIVFQPGQTYRIDDEITIRASGIALLGSETRLTGSGRIVVNGDTGIPGDESDTVEGFRMSGFLMSGSFRGPILRRCRGFELADLARDNTAGTWINILYCTDGVVRDCDARNGERTKIAYLVVGGRNISGLRCKISGGEWVYGFQIKGGTNHWFRDCSIDNVAWMKHGFRIRGDAPWGPSRTRETYPFADGAWSKPDVRRASRQCGYADCAVRNGAGVHFLATEFVDCAFLRCRSIAGYERAPEIALFAYRQEQGHESGLRIEDFNATGSSRSAVFLRGADASRPLDKVEVLRPVVSGAGGNAIDARFCAGLAIEHADIRRSRGAGVALLDCAAWRILQPSISGCMAGVTVDFATIASDIIGTLDDATGIAGNEVGEVKCWFPLDLGQAGRALQARADGAGQLVFPQRFALPGTRDYEIALRFEWRGGGRSGAYSTTLRCRTRNGRAELADGAAPLEVETGSGMLVVTPVAGEVRFVVRGAEGAEHALTTIASREL